MKKYIKIFVMLCIILIFVISVTTIADVGNFESYDSDSSSSSSSSSDSGGSSGSGYHSSVGSGLRNIVGGMVVVAIVALNYSLKEDRTETGKRRYLIWNCILIAIGAIILYFLVGIILNAGSTMDEEISVFFVLIFFFTLYILFLIMENASFFAAFVFSIVLTFGLIILVMAFIAAFHISPLFISLPLLLFDIFYIKKNFNKIIDRFHMIYEPANSFKPSIVPKTSYTRDYKRNNRIINEIKKKNNDFNVIDFTEDIGNKFIQLQKAWSERNWEKVRSIESKDLFELHSLQIQNYIAKGQINKIEDINVNFVDFVSYSYSASKEIIVVALNSSMKDYIVHEKTGQIVKGNRNRILVNTYKLTFMRSKDVNSQTEQETINCPNCGAPTKINSSGKCEYCNAIIIKNKYDWILIDMERY